MGIIKKNISFLKRHQELADNLEKGLKKVSEKIIAETKEKNSYLVISDKKGNIKKVPAKDL